MSRRVVARVGVCLTLFMGALVASVSAAEEARAGALTCDARNPLTEQLRNELAFGYPGRRFTAVVTDRSGCTYLMNPSFRIGTASVVKMEFMAGVLLRAQSENRGLTQWEYDRIWPMITQSANTPASELWNYLGQDAGMKVIDVAFGLTETQHAGAVWGLTTTSAADQARLVRELIPGMGGPLTAPYRAMARYFMTNVILEQRWGASSGVPFGWVVAQKNGFAGSQCCNWRINSVGWVERPGGTGWAIAVLSDGWPTEAEGIAAINQVSARINHALVEPFFPGASSVVTSVDRQDMFVRTTAGTISQRQWTSTDGYAGWVDVGGIAMSDPDAALPSPTTYPQVFVIGSDSALWQAIWSGDSWVWTSHGGACSSGPSSIYSGPTRLDVFCRGSDGALYTKTWKSATGWTGWSSMGGLITSDPDAASGGDASNLEVIARGGDNALWEYTRTGTTWTYQSLGGTCTSGPGTTFSGPDRLDVFCIGTDGHPWVRTRSLGAWSAWSALPGLAASDPDAVSQGGGSSPRIFARGPDGAVYQWLFVGSAWSLQSWGQP